MATPDPLASIDDLEASIRAAFAPWKPPHDYMNIGGSLVAKRYEGALQPGIILDKKDMAQHALWYLEAAREAARAGKMKESVLCVGVAAGVMLPFGVAIGYSMPLGVAVYPAMVNPCVAEQPRE